MPENILPETETMLEATASADYWTIVWQDLLQKMTPTAAAEKLGLNNKAIWTAIRRGEIVPYQFSGQKVYVTPRIVAMWAEEHCRVPQATPLPG